MEPGSESHQTLNQSRRKGPNFFQSTRYRIYDLITHRSRENLVATRLIPPQGPPVNHVGVLHANETTSPTPYSSDEHGLMQEALLPPALRLPVEILQEIFDVVSHQDRFSVDNIGYSFCRPKDLPWGISQVCRQWRYIVLSSPFLWATLPGINLLSNHTRQKDYVDGLADILKRSRNALITVHVSGVGFTDRTHPVADLLVQHSRRWQKITLYIPLKGLLAFNGAKGNLSSLRTLVAEWKEMNPTDYDSEGTFDLFLKAPELRNISIMKGDVGELQLPHKGLLKYVQRFGCMDKVNDFICSSPGLRHLELVLLKFVPGISSHNLQMANLVFLRIHRVDNGLLRWLLASISAPVLEELNIDAFPDSITPAITSMVSRSAPSLLQKLYLRTAFGTPGQLTDLLILTPKLFLLSVTMPPSDDIRALTASRVYGSVLTPILRDCRFEIMLDTSEEQMCQAASFANARPELKYSLQRY
ncbi:hypothetical protein GALMADRAFT_207926 [Galerina marginata CBS 339.88]|uniref:Uncharacterized protein n=1 Tax=Galerina marginata (strain CBS 339.88) TaxID=685588 RepID=A0A067TCX0_GALM3|nr:hypothetical protein GALMADRAFT_207926 [Galerina marginata CBS 339.88]